MRRLRHCYVWNADWTDVCVRLQGLAAIGTGVPPSRPATPAIYRNTSGVQPVPQRD
jgi:hypothetical protein